MYKPRVYTASRLKYFSLWQTFRDDPDWAFVEFTATWIDKAYHEIEAQPSEEMFSAAWIENIADIKRSDFVLAYAGGDLAIRNAMVEVGVALGNGIGVVAVGLDLDQFTWGYHPAVKRFSSLREARLHLYKYTAMVPPASRRRKEAEDGTYN